MPRKKKQEPAPSLTGIILDAMIEKIARDPVVIDFTGINGSLCDSFVICHGTSRTQVEAIARHVWQEVKKKTGLNPSHMEGEENAEWILIDYFDVVVHIFQEERRRFYNLEQLWADARLLKHDAPR
ncbi:MAG TPA: ribosome silencing factor [Bacteroidales bacterium]|nr:ribosome silencing factor [Bacteroidales bacterium]HPS62217.1 ribosome silencing factor [Bacteroidales bacterium]